MKLHKSYRLLRYLNRRHNALERNTLAVLGASGTLVCTRSSVLAGAMLREFRQDHFDTALRKAARYARLFSPRLDLCHDPFFDFTVGTTAAERRVLAELIRTRDDRRPESFRLSDLAYIKAADIHDAIERGEQPDADIDAYYQLINRLLQQLPAPAHAAGLQKTSRPSDFSREQAVQALRDIAAILPLDEWPWFVMSGTFLGLHRENGFLAHDYDIDLGVHAAQVDLQALLAWLRSQSLFVLRTVDWHIEIRRNTDGSYRLDRKLSLIKLVHPNGMHVDLFIHYTENDRCWHGSRVHRWENTPFGLVRRTMEGVAVNAPADADRYLTENYGQWRVPVTDFNCTTGTPNLVMSRNFTSLSLFLKRLVHFSKHDPGEAGKLRQLLVQVGALQKVSGRLAATHWL